MKKLQLLFVLGLFISLSACGSLDSRGDSSHSHSFWGTTSGKVWKTGFGTCWRTIGYTSDEECGGAPVPTEPEVAGYFWSDDQDRDGVLDGDDMCPFTPEGVQVESNGCAVDSDGDGVPDYLDQCPLGKVVDTTGCAYKIVKLEGVHFAFDSSRLTDEAKSILDKAASEINAHSSSSFTVEGHTDSYGSDEYNQQLSERRANAVMNYLISRGVPASSLSAIGKGENYPVASNDSREGRAENRRVVVLAR